MLPGAYPAYTRAPPYPPRPELLRTPSVRSSQNAPPPRPDGAGPPEGETGRGPDRGHPTGRAGGGASSDCVRCSELLRTPLGRGSLGPAPGARQARWRNTLTEYYW